MKKEFGMLSDAVATSNWRSTKVDVCKACEGQGRKPVFVGRGRDDEWSFEQCKVCAGHGMVIKKLVVNIYPFDNKKVV